MLLPSPPLPPLTYQFVEPLLDFMWYYECIVSPRHKLPLTSHPHQQNTPTSPQLPTTATASSACPLPSPPSSPIIILSSTEQQWLQRVFHTFDENRDGKLTQDELVSSMHKLGISMSASSVMRLLSSVSLESNEHVDLQEFFLLYQSSCGAMEELCQKNELEEDNVDDEDLREAFSVFDKNGDGFISPSELQGVLCNMGFPQGRELSACKEMISKVDEDGNGQVDFLEFKKMMCSSDLVISCH